MNLVRFTPNSDLANRRRGVDSFLDAFFGDFFNREMGELTQGWNPKVDVFEEDDRIVMKAELPGVEKDKIAIDVDGRILTLKGERNSDSEVKKENYYRRERSYGRFQRSFTLPLETDSEKIKAEYKDGVLQLNIPKPESQRPKKITIE